jgi:DNA-directed RNA polymerase specialized sigma24 family protein
MDSLSRGSVTTWLSGLKNRSDGAAQEIWNRYFDQLVRLAHRQLQGLARDGDEEDVALSALKSAMLGVQNNRFPDLNDRTGLWPLLVTITARKAINEIKLQRTKKRDRAMEATFADVSSFVGTDPSPEFALQLAEEIEKLVRALGDETLRTIVGMTLEGYTNEEIALKLDVSTRTVVRKLRRVRQEWEEGGPI